MPIVPVRRQEPAPVDPADIVARPRTRRQPPPTEVEPASPKPGYEVGYARPPKHTRFRPGQSGNPKGRPKGAKAMKTIVREILTEKVTVRTPKGPKRMTKVQALLAKTTELGFAGNLRALQLLLQYYQQSVVEPATSISATAATAEEIAPDAHDLAIIEEMRALLRAEMEERP